MQRPGCRAATTTPWFARAADRDRARRGGHTARSDPDRHEERQSPKRRSPPVRRMTSETATTPASDGDRARGERAAIHRRRLRTGSPRSADRLEDRDRRRAVSANRARLNTALIGADDGEMTTAHRGTDQVGREQLRRREREQAEHERQVAEREAVRLHCGSGGGRDTPRGRQNANATTKTAPEPGAARSSCDRHEANEDAPARLRAQQRQPVEGRMTRTRLPASAPAPPRSLPAGARPGAPLQELPDQLLARPRAARPGAPDQLLPDQVLPDHGCPTSCCPTSCSRTSCCPTSCCRSTCPPDQRAPGRLGTRKRARVDRLAEDVLSHRVSTTPSRGDVILPARSLERAAPRRGGEGLPRVDQRWRLREH